MRAVVLKLIRRQTKVLATNSKSEPHFSSGVATSRLHVERQLMNVIVWVSVSVHVSIWLKFDFFNLSILTTGSGFCLVTNPFGQRNLCTRTEAANLFKLFNFGMLLHG